MLVHGEFHASLGTLEQGGAPVEIIVGVGVQMGDDPLTVLGPSECWALGVTDDALFLVSRTTGDEWEETVASLTPPGFGYEFE